MKRSNTMYWLGFSMLVLAGMVFLVITSSKSQAQDEARATDKLPQAVAALSATIFSYQGQLVDASGNPITDPAVDISFKLYPVAADGVACWTENHTGADAVAVQDGYFHILLGQLAALDESCLSGDAYLELIVNGEKLSPRELLTSVAHAVEAQALSAGADTRGDLTMNGLLDMNGHAITNAFAINAAPSTPNLFLTNDNGSIRLASSDNITIFIDSDNSSIENRLLVYKNGKSATGAAAQIMALNENGDLSIMGHLASSGNLTVNGNGVTKIEGDLQIGANSWVPSYAGMDGNDLAVDGMFEQSGSGGAYLAKVGVGRNPRSEAGSLAVAGETEIDGNLRVDGSGQNNIASSQDVKSTGEGALRIGSSTDWMAIDAQEISSYGNRLFLQHSGATEDVDIGTNLTIGGRIRSPVNSDLTIDPGMGSLNTLKLLDNVEVEGNLTIGGPDLILHNPERGDAGRALVHWRDDTLGINYEGDFTSGVDMWGPLQLHGSCSLVATNEAEGSVIPVAERNQLNCEAGSLISGAYVEANLMTPEERTAGEVTRFERGDLLCWTAETQQLALCDQANDRLVQAVADANGNPIVLGAEPLKVLGPVTAGDILVSSADPGYAMVNNDPAPGTVIGQSLQDFDGDYGFVKSMIRKW